MDLGIFQGTPPLLRYLPGSPSSPTHTLGIILPACFGLFLGPPPLLWYHPGIYGLPLSSCPGVPPRLPALPCPPHVQAWGVVVLPTSLGQALSSLPPGQDAEPWGEDAPR